MTDAFTRAESPALSIERQAAALLDVVESDCVARCEALTGAAQRQANELCRQAHHAARERMRRAFDDERRLRAERLAAAAANLETRRRLANQTRDAALLEAGLRALPAALQARWQEEGARCLWVQQAIASALTSLPRRAWQIAHAPGWEDDERRAIERQLHGMLVEAPAFCCDAAMVAGLAIEVEGTRIDATLRGLLSDRADVGARLLDKLRAAAGGPRAAARR